MIASAAVSPLCRTSQMKAEHSLRKVEQILNKSINEFYNCDDINSISLEL